ncbi:MAG TPA: ATP-dependent Clp protease adaptor ClpS [Acidimicrobiales bacterium]|nr:ATP-dependent Clp protease adaptor ClpS [Acidimicrobiales bacterium]
MHATTDTIPTLDTPVVPDEDIDKLLDDEDLWAVVVWNDDVNTFAHVIKALMEILHHPRPRAEQLTLLIHNTGKALVAIRPKDEAEAAVHGFHSRGIQATLEPA